jgi:hypothetical protein
MDGGYFRANVPDEWEEPYQRNLRETQERARAREDEIDDRPWRRLRRNPDGGAGS